jgi:hypothetical protein
VGIASDPAVIFADDFESHNTANDLLTRWNNLFQVSNTRIATESANRFAGAKGFEFKIPQQNGEVSNAVWKNLSTTQDILFVRCYTKFDAGFANGASGHNGISVEANYSGPGIPADGKNKFYVGIENSPLFSEAAPGYTHLYIYHPEQRDIWGDHWYPDGTVVPFTSTPGNYGPNFVSRPNFTPQRDRWYSYELMVQANTPGQRDGRIAIWIDGNLIADFLNVRLRDVDTLKMDRVQLQLHQNGATSRENKKWYDNVVIARSYIGPMVSSQQLNAPTGLRIVP